MKNIADSAASPLSSTLNTNGQNDQVSEKPGKTAAEYLAENPRDFFAGMLYYNQETEDTIEQLHVLISAIERQEDLLNVQDYCAELKRELFTHTMAFDAGQKAFCSGSPVPPTPVAAITVPNTVPHLLHAIWNHDDCPVWLQDVIWNGIDNRIDGATKFSPTYWASQLESCRPDGVGEHEHRYGLPADDETEPGSQAQEEPG